MKLLLTSSGLSNKSIARALLDLVRKPANKTTVVFIPTAMNVESGEKEWFITDLQNLKKQKYRNIDIVDISALPKKVWLPRIKKKETCYFFQEETRPT